MSPRLRALLGLVLLAINLIPAIGQNLIPAGASRIDISPTNAVRMMGYAARANLPAPTNAAQRIHARALALGGGAEAAVLITIDNCILPGAITEEIRARLGRRLQLPPERIALMVTHTHSAPCLKGAAPNIFAQDIAPDDQREIDLYTAWFTDRLEEAATRAMAAREPARVEWSQGSVGFAKNRRTPGGPVDHALPVLQVSAPDGTVRAVWASYACHCTTLGGEFNQHHGDWAGVAALQLEEEIPGAVALVSIGCGADSNPDPRGTVDLVNRHGRELAAEAKRVSQSRMIQLTNSPLCALRTIQLPFEQHFTRAEWQARATNSGIIGYHARKWLARLDRGEAPSPTLPYPVQTWRFGNQLAIVFLGGEVVVDYSLRLKSELDPERLWVNGYANEVPCYIPSRRILTEGGYEAETSLWYYDRPQRLAPALEDLIVGAVKEMLPEAWRIDPRSLEFPNPKSPPEALRTFRHDARFNVELVASEPLVESPVAIDFGADGRLWVCEMFDYPSGLGAEGRPGGRVKVLSDTNGDGSLDTAELVADDLPYPTGLMAWRDGVIVCAAPDVLYLRPRTGGGWERQTLLSGFATHNFQARVNGLRWGLDGWVYGSGGLFGGRIEVRGTTSGSPPGDAKTAIECSNRDFRWRPDTGEFEALAGVSQQGRTRDDFNEWFGNDNSTLLWHFALPDHYARRNPFVAPPEPRVMLNRDNNRVFPASRTLARFNDPHTANQLTSACAPEIYRDDLLGREFEGNAFICEPVHNLIRRARLEPDGATFSARRSEAESSSEFLASTDNWFRPVEVRTGPDGALWIVDFHRFVIEHPRWIPADRLKELDVRAGAGMGRIYRLVPAGSRARPIRNLRTMDALELARVLRSSSGTERDLAHRELLDRARVESPRRVASLLGESAAFTPAGAEAQRLALLHQLEPSEDTLLLRALRFSSPRLRRFVLTLLEPATPESRMRAPAIEILALAEDPDPAVRYQLALTLGEFRSPAAARTLGRIARRDGTDPRVRAAILSSVLSEPAAYWEEFSRGSWLSPGFRTTFEPLLASLAGADQGATTDGIPSRVLADIAQRVFPEADEGAGSPFEQYTLLNVLASRPGLYERVAAALGTDAPRLARARAAADRRAMGWISSSIPEGDRLPVLRYLAAAAGTDANRRRDFLALIEAKLPSSLQSEWSRALGTIRAPELAVEALAHWSSFSVAQRGGFIASLLTREQWTFALLDAVEAGLVASGELTPAQRRQLRSHPRPEIATRAARLFPPPSADRGPIVSQFTPAASLKPDPTRGAGHFDRLCSTCHQIRGRGNAVGPELAVFRSKPVTDFLTAILDPNAAIEPRFVAYVAETRDGRSLTGVVQDESASALTLVQAGGVRETLLRSDIQSLIASPQSLMPEGLEQGLGPQDLADLIAWIKSAPGPFGGASEADIEAARMRFVAGNPSGFTQPESSNEMLPYPGWLGRRPLFYCRQSAGQSRLAWRSTVPAAEDGRIRFRWPAAMGLVSQPAGRFTLRLEGKDVVDFNATLEDGLWTAENTRTVLRYTVAENNAEDSCGLLELEIDATATGLKPGSTVRIEALGSASNSQRWFGVYHLPGIN